MFSQYLKSLRKLFEFLRSKFKKEVSATDTNSKCVKSSVCIEKLLRLIKLMLSETRVHKLSYHLIQIPNSMLMVYFCYIRD